MKDEAATLVTRHSSLVTRRRSPSTQPLTMTIRRLFEAILALALFSMALTGATDPDMWWHLRTGEAILRDGLPRHDLFSFTVPDHAWVTHEWLSQVFMWLVYQAGGFAALIVVFAAIIAATFGLVYQSCAGRPYFAGFVTILAAVTSALTWGPRPQMFNLLFLALFVWLVERVRAGASLRWLWLLPILTVIWANLHSGYLLGVVLLATYTVGEALQGRLGPRDGQARDGRGARALAAATVASLLAALLNPSGYELWIYPFLTLGSDVMQSRIVEWHSPDFHEAIVWPFGAMLALGALLWAFNPRRPAWSDLLLFLGTGAAGLLSARHIPLFAIVAAPILARYGLACLEGARLYPILSGARPSVRPPPLMQAVNWLVVGLMVLLAGARVATTIEQSNEAVATQYPVAAVNFLERSGLAEGRGYNSYNWGGYLIWRGLPVFVDGRADVYGDKFLTLYFQAFGLDEGWQESLDEYEVDWVLMERGSNLAILLDSHAAWRRVYRDEVASIFVRAGE